MRRSTTAARQRGAVMITALMILLLMTIFGISTMDTNILEEKMAGNLRDRNTAFQAAESALRAAESWIAAQSVLPDVRDVSDESDTSPLWDLNSADPDKQTEDEDDDDNVPWWDEPERSTQSWWTTNAVVLSGSAKVAGLSDAHQPAYLIEKLPPRPGSLEAAQSLEGADTFLMVTARGIGQSDTTVVILQSVYKW
ncbi:MAG: hypothetical protein KDI83_14525 [Gammaproteobacteria bacterium]|nr:hypothetical protein [Gammaproteobacteria bacterium]